MTTRIRLILATAVLAVLSAWPIQASDTCPAGTISISEDLDRTVREAVDAKKGQTIDEDLKKAQGAVNNRVTAPGSAHGGTSIVDLASFPSLLGMAVENGLLKNEDNISTVDLNFFAFLSMARPQVVFDQQQYQEYEWLRRLGGTASFGGKGLKFDRDGNGTADEPLEATALNDIVTWELLFRPSRSRDPREKYNFEEITNAVEPPQLDFSDKETGFLIRHRDEIRNMDPDGIGCANQAAWEGFLDQPAVAAEVADIGAAAKATLDTRDKAVQTIASRLVWSLFAGGVERKPQFGPDSIRAGLRMDWRKNTFNLEWMKTDALVGNDEPQSLKAGYKYTTKWLKGSLTPDGVDLSASGSYQVFRDDPDAKHDTVAKLNVAFEYPIATGMKIPVSVTWANHADLLTGEKDIRGHIGFTIDLSKLAKATDK